MGRRFYKDLDDDSDDDFESQRERFSARYGGIDNDVQQFFFSLNPYIKSAVFADYKRIYGSGKARYAQESYQKWKTGKVSMSCGICERLLDIVPSHMSLDDKYKLLDKLYRNRDVTWIELEVAADLCVEEVIGKVIRLIEQNKPQRISPSIICRLGWLSNNDGQAAQALLTHVIANEYLIVTELLSQQLPGILAAASQHSHGAFEFSVKRQIRLPGSILHLTITSHRTHGMKAGPIMSSNEPTQPESPRQSSGGQLTPVGSNAGDSPLVPIQNTHQLLEEALKRVSPEKQRELLETAAKQALRLQVKMKEDEVDAEAIERRIDLAARAGSLLSQQDDAVRGEFSTTHRSSQGETLIKVQKVQESRLGGCFIATACYGDYDHPAVLELRAFRDDYLLGSAPGRFFVGLYYKHSPCIARALERSDPERWLVRCLLEVAVRVLRASRRRTRLANRGDTQSQCRHQQRDCHLIYDAKDLEI